MHSNGSRRPWPPPGPGLHADEGRDGEAARKAAGNGAGDGQHARSDHEAIGVHRVRDVGAQPGTPDLRPSRTGPAR